MHAVAFGHLRLVVVTIGLGEALDVAHGGGKAVTQLLKDGEVVALGGLRSPEQGSSSECLVGEVALEEHL